MSKRKILVVEDDVLIAKHIERSLSSFGYEVVGPCYQAEDALELLNKSQVDLAMLDVELNHVIDGIQLAHIIKNDFGYPIIFLTSYTDETTLERMKPINPMGYVVKPFNKFGLRNTIELVFDKLEHENQELQGETKTLVQEDNAKSIFVRGSKNIEKIVIDDIAILEASGKYVLIHQEGRKNIANTSIKELLGKLPSQKFIQVHRSYVINFDMIKEIGTNFLTVMGQEVPIGRSYKEQVMKRITVL